MTQLIEAPELLEPISLQEFQERVRELTERQRRRLEQELGSPPDIRRVKKEFWEEAERERRQMMAVLLFSLALSISFDDLDRFPIDRELDYPDFQRRLRREAERRARQVSVWMDRSSRRMLRRAVRVEDMNSEDLSVRVFGDDRASRVMMNEAVAAATVSKRAVRGTARRIGLDVTHVWLLGPCEHCDVCPMLHMTPEEYWGQVCSGPPLHINCCCSTVLFFEDSQTLIDNGLLRSNLDSIRDVISAMEEAGFR